MRRARFVGRFVGRFVRFVGIPYAPCTVGTTVCAQVDMSLSFGWRGQPYRGDGVQHRPVCGSLSGSNLCSSTCASSPTPCRSYVLSWPTTAGGCGRQGRKIQITSMLEELRSKCRTNDHVTSHALLRHKHKHDKTHTVYGPPLSLDHRLPSQSTGSYSGLHLF